MPTEIERKFLVRGAAWRDLVHQSIEYRQGYLASTPASSVRVRLGDGRAHLNIKSATLGLQRLEYEYEIPVDEAGEILDHLCEGPLVEKTRHLIRFAGKLWEVDEFAGENAGLIVAEVELDRPDEPIELPAWVGEDVSEDSRYYNACLVDRPFLSWPESERQQALEP